MKRMRWLSFTVRKGGKADLLRAEIPPQCQSDFAVLADFNNQNSLRRSIAFLCKMVNGYDGGGRPFYAARPSDFRVTRETINTRDGDIKVYRVWVDIAFNRGYRRDWLSGMLAVFNVSEQRRISIRNAKRKRDKAK